MPVGPVDLVAGEGVEVAIESLHVDGQVRHRLRAIHQHGDAVRVRQLDHLAHRD